MMSREQLHHLSGAYVLNALDEEERIAFEERLAEWDDMRSEVTELADTAAALGLALPPVQPRLHVRQELLERVAQTAQLPPERAAVRRRRRLRPVAGLPAGTAPAWHSTPLLWAAAAVAVVLAVLVVGLPLTDDGRRADVTLAQVLDAPDARRVAVPLAGAQEVELVWSEDLEASALAWEALPPLERGTVYELWYVGDSARPAGLVADATAGGRVLEGAMEPGDRVAVTIEPAGGSPQPTTEPVVVVDFA